jgi:hemerythrin-like metal-binding protein
MGAHHAFTIALHGSRRVCDPVIHLLRAHEHFGEAGIAWREDPADFVRMVGRRRDVACVLIVWSGADAGGLAELVAALRRRQPNLRIPVLVRSAIPLCRETRARLKAAGVYGPHCREELGEATLAEDLLHAMEEMHERVALAALSAFAQERRRIASLPELAEAALAFLHANGIGDYGGLFCLFRTTSTPEWVVVAGTGCFGALAGVRVAELDAPVRLAIEGAQPDEEPPGPAVCLPAVTPEGSRLCLYLAQSAPLMPWQETVAALLRSRLAVTLDEIMLRLRLARTQHAHIATLATLAEYRDVDTGQHVSRVSRNAIEVARVLAEWGVGGEDMAELMRHIGHASVLHDIGKVGVPDRILLKPGPLEPEERRIMQGHTLLGHEILARAVALSEGSLLMAFAAEIARSHHERWDGGGYPDALAGEAIPLAARIVAVADVFDALTGERPYKRAWSEEQALDFICAQAGAQFDPKVVEAFLVVTERARSGSPIAWSEEFSVGQPALDRDHEKLFGILNQLWGLHRAGDAGQRQVAEMVLDDLMHYSQSHFAREEAHMEAVGYPQRAAHRRAHEAFVRHVEALRWEFVHGLRSDIPVELGRYLSQWLMEHVGRFDRLYSQCGVC